MEARNGPFVSRLNMTSEAESTLKARMTHSFMLKIVASYKETVVMATSVGLFGLLLIASFYGMYHLFMRKRLIVMPVTSKSAPVSDYFTRPREPVIFLHDLSEHLKEEPAAYWQRPLQPVTTGADLYSLVVW